MNSCKRIACSGVYAVAETSQVEDRNKTKKERRKKKWE
jgi:hypothetical protein